VHHISLYLPVPLILVIHHFTMCLSTPQFFPLSPKYTIPISSLAHPVSNVLAIHYCLLKWLLWKSFSSCYHSNIQWRGNFLCKRNKDSICMSSRLGQGTAQSEGADWVGCRAIY
jgi:hypothetical protein